MPHHPLRAAVLALCAATALAPAAAQDSGAAAPQPGANRLALSLNALSPSADGCRLSFVVKNAMAAEIEDLSIEIAVFEKAGALDRMLRLSFGVLLQDKTRVRQFDLDGTPCDGIGNVLINDVAICTGGDLTPLACLRALDTTTGTDVAFGL